MRGFRSGMFGGGFQRAEAYILQRGEHDHSHRDHRREFMRGFKGGMFGGGFRTGRKFDAGDLQLIILALLSEQPRHGYELIKVLEERSGGFYVPSPGVIYPALTFLEETGLAEVEVSGTKKLYRITENGQKRVDENRALIEITLAKLSQIGERMAHVKKAFGGESGEAERGWRLRPRCSGSAGSPASAALCNPDEISVDKGRRRAHCRHSGTRRSGHPAPHA
jgi:DNA-binding PadR family transcriptional regulator